MTVKVPDDSTYKPATSTMSKTPVAVNSFKPAVSILDAAFELELGLAAAVLLGV